MKQRVSRRDFLRFGAMSAGALPFSLAPDRESSRAAAQAGGPAKRVIVLGAGLAGLSASYELIRLGHQIIVLEARMRPGGRVYTLREPFSDGLHVEAGARFVPGYHDFTVKYVKEFNLRLIPVDFQSRQIVYFLNGKRIIPKPGDSIVEFTEEEKALGRRGRWEKYIGSVLGEIGDPTAPNWPAPSLQQYDQITFSDFLRSRGASPGFVTLTKLGLLQAWGDGIDSYSALSALRESALEKVEQTSQTIDGGVDLLPKAFAARLKDNIRYGAPVVRIEHNNRGVRVKFLAGGGVQSLEADRVICTIPFSVLGRVEIDPPFSQAKQRAIRELPYTSVARVYLQFRRRFWTDANLAGFALTDLPIMRCLNATIEQPGPRGILESYMSGPSARLVTGVAESERLKFTLEHLEKVFPGAREHIEGGASKCWDDDEWSRGDYNWFRPGQMISLFPHIARPEGRVHFAGDHASPWPGWMQGALQSGNRAAREVQEAAG
ncbi:MAG TPA: flavin monoamine oxidase family protein [Acidobacteriota bacterium]|jgi:monoamine oxidase